MYSLISWTFSTGREEVFLSSITTIADLILGPGLFLASIVLLLIFSLLQSFARWPDCLQEKLLPSLASCSFSLSGIVPYGLEFVSSGLALAKCAKLIEFLASGCAAHFFLSAFMLGGAFQSDLGNRIGFPPDHC